MAITGIPRSSSILNHREVTMVARLVPLATVALLTGSQLSAAQSVLGVGDVPCGEWLRVRAFEAPKGNTKALATLYYLKTWIDGYISGNVAAEGQPDILGPRPQGTAMYSAVDNYCRIHPLDPIASGAVALVKELQERAQHK
jgi:hypothetical protein